MMTPAFHQEVIRNYVKIFYRSGLELLVNCLFVYAPFKKFNTFYFNENIITYNFNGLIFFHLQTNGFLSIGLLISFCYNLNAVALQKQKDSLTMQTILVIAIADILVRGI